MRESNIATHKIHIIEPDKNNYSLLVSYIHEIHVHFFVWLVCFPSFFVVLGGLIHLNVLEQHPTTELHPGVQVKYTPGKGTQR